MTFMERHYKQLVSYYGLMVQLEMTISNEHGPGLVCAELLSVPGYSPLMELGLGPQILWATEAYALGRQPLRNHSEDPYIFHPLAVALAAADLDLPRPVVEAALFHDIVEDTDFELAHIFGLWGGPVTQCVEYMTEVPTGGNRAVRKGRELARLARGSGPEQTLKILDLWDNARSILAHDPDFAPTFAKEAGALLDALVLADPAAQVLLGEQLLAWEARTV